MCLLRVIPGVVLSATLVAATAGEVAADPPGTQQSTSLHRDRPGTIRLASHGYRDRYYFSPYSSYYSPYSYRYRYFRSYRPRYNTYYRHRFMPRFRYDYYYRPWHPYYYSDRYYGSPRGYPPQRFYRPWRYEYRYGSYGNRRGSDFRDECEDGRRPGADAYQMPRRKPDTQERRRKSQRVPSRERPPRPNSADPPVPPAEQSTGTSGSSEDASAKSANEATGNGPQLPGPSPDKPSTENPPAPGSDEP